MASLKQHLLKEIEKLPRHLLKRKLGDKLKHQGIENSLLLDALTDHVLSNGSEPFSWDDGEDGPTKNLKIVFSEEDGDEILDSLNTFLKEGLPNVVNGSIQDGAKSLVRALERKWPEQKVHEHNDMRYFRDRIDLRWSKGLDPLRKLLIASREVGQDFADRLARSKAKHGLVKRHALMILHMRACQTAMEILTLLENGLADGAYARWRTLYEVSVVAFVIDRFGDEIAERYLDHDVVSMREAAINDLRHEGKEYVPGSLRGDLKELEDDFKALIEKYGKSFAGQYGWASHHLDIKAPRFCDLERAVDRTALPPDYKWSSYKVHAGISGAVRGLGTIGGLPLIHSGASNAGLDTPAINTAYSLLHVTSLVFDRRDELEKSVQMQALIILRDKVTKECRKAARKLESEEFELRIGTLD